MFDGWNELGEGGGGGISRQPSTDEKRGHSFMGGEETRAYSRRDFCFLPLWWRWWWCERRVSRHPRGGIPRRRSRHWRMHPRRCSRRKSAVRRRASAAVVAAAADEWYSGSET